MRLANGFRLGPYEIVAPRGAGGMGEVYRALFKEFAPTDRAGLLSVREIFGTDDLGSYAYTAYHQRSSLLESEAQP
jgi:hypothetical protein